MNKPDLSMQPMPVPLTAGTVPISIGLTGTIQAGSSFTCTISSPTGQNIPGPLNVYFVAFVNGQPFKCALMSVPGNNQPSYSFTVPATVGLPPQGQLVAFVTNQANTYAGVSMYYNIPSTCAVHPVIAVDVVIIELT